MQLFAAKRSLARADAIRVALLAPPYRCLANAASQPRITRQTRRQRQHEPTTHKARLTPSPPAPAKSGEPLGAVLSPRQARGFKRYAPPALGHNTDLRCCSLALACYGGSGRVALWSRRKAARHGAPVASAPTRPPARWLVTLHFGKGLARYAAAMPPLPRCRSSLAAGLPRVSVFPPLLPSGGSRLVLRTRLGGLRSAPPSGCSAPAGAVVEVSAEL